MESLQISPEEFETTPAIRDGVTIHDQETRGTPTSTPTIP